MISDADVIAFMRNIKKLMPRDDRNTMIVGTITGIDPLRVDIGDGVELTEDFLVLGQMCRPQKVTIPHTHEFNGETEKGTATSGGTSITPAGTVIPNPNPTKTNGDLTMAFAGQGALTVTEFTGHSHKIENQVTEDVHKQGSDYEEYVTIEIEPKLAVGDKVLMFAFNNFQKYYIAERVKRESLIVARNK